MAAVPIGALTDHRRVAFSGNAPTTPMAFTTPAYVSSGPSLADLNEQTISRASLAPDDCADATVSMACPSVHVRTPISINAVEPGTEPKPKHIGKMIGSHYRMTPSRAFVPRSTRGEAKGSMENSNSPENA